MEGRRGRAGGAALLAAALVALMAEPAAAAPHVTVGSLSSLKAGARAGTLHGTVVNRSHRAAHARVTVRAQRYGTTARIVGRTSVRVAAGRTQAYRVRVKVPAGLERGNYYLSACTPNGLGAGRLGCATAERDLKIKGGIAIRGALVKLPARAAKAHASQAPACSSGAHTLVAPGERVYPEAGNGGYVSIHTDVYTVYDAIANLLLPGTHVVHEQRSTQCLTDFSLDFDAKNGLTIGGAPGTDMTVQSITVNGQPATFKFVQPTYPGDPNGQDDPDPLAHRTGLTSPISADNPNPPACAPFLAPPRPPATEPNPVNQPCPATKLVITPAAPIPSGTDFTVTVDYTGRPGIRAQGDGRSEGWFRNATPGTEGAMVTSEPMGTMAWMPLNDHTRVKPTYDFYDTVTKGKVAIGNGRLISTGDNAPDANFPGGSTSWHWKSSEPVAAYLVENSIGSFEWSERQGANGVLYYEAQDAGITPQSRKDLNLKAMHEQENITHFQEQFNGPFPFNANGILVMRPNASFEEEMQTKIVFVNGTIGGAQGTNLATFSHENMHQWWGDNVSYYDHRLTFFKEGQADTSERFYAAKNAADLVGGQGTPAGDAAFEVSLANYFATQYNQTGTYWTIAPSNPTSANLFGNSNTYRRPGASYLALRTILGKDNYNAALHEIQHDYGGGSITEPQLEAVFHKYMTNQSAACSAKLDQFFTQWWDTAYPAGGGVNRPTITGPGLVGGGFYDAACPEQVNGSGTVGGAVPAQLSLSLGTPAAFGPFTPGLAKTYTAQSTGTVTSTAGDGALSVTDPSSNAPGHLVNGAFSLPQALKASAASAAGTPTPAGSVSGAPLNVLTYTGPTSNDGVTFTFTQDIGSSDALRTGTYSKTLTFTLSTTNP